NLCPVRAQALAGPVLEDGKVWGVNAEASEDWVGVLTVALARGENEHVLHLERGGSAVWCGQEGEPVERHGTLARPGWPGDDRVTVARGGDGPVLFGRDGGHDGVQLRAGAVVSGSLRHAVPFLARLLPSGLSCLLWGVNGG